MLKKKIVKQIKLMFDYYGSDKLLETLNYSKDKKEASKNEYLLKQKQEVASFDNKFGSDVAFTAIAGAFTIPFAIVGAIKASLTFLLVPVFAWLTALGITYSLEKSIYNIKLNRLSVGKFIVLTENYGEEVIDELKRQVQHEYNKLLKKGDTSKLENFRQKNQMLLTSQIPEFETLKNADLKIEKSKLSLNVNKNEKTNEFNFQK